MEVEKYTGNYRENTYQNTVKTPFFKFATSPIFTPDLQQFVFKTFYPYNKSQQKIAQPNIW